MPSIKAVDQIWDPMQTLFADVAKDAFRAKNGEAEKYTDVDSMQKALDNSVQSIYDAIYTLAQ
jgi:arabinogalactan oligomer/maltooligosaccharide transport system substrate-binding protein